MTGKNVLSQIKIDIDFRSHIFFVDGFWFFVDGVSGWGPIVSTDEQSSPQPASDSEWENIENFLLRHLSCPSNDRPYLS